MKPARKKLTVEQQQREVALAYAKELRELCEQPGVSEERKQFLVERAAFLEEFAAKLNTMSAAEALSEVRHQLVCFLFPALRRQAA